MNNLKSFESLLRTASTKEAFLATLQSLPTPDVRIDDDALASYASSLQKPKFISPWSEYLTPGNDLATDFVELAVSTVQQGGYLYQDEKGALKKWEIGGSGAKALLSKMDEARNRKILPALDIQDQVSARKKLRDHFNGAPYQKERLTLWTEMAHPGVTDRLMQILDDARQGGNTYAFNFAALKGLAEVLPKGLGEDPFLKKAALLPILFAGVAHNKGESVLLDVVVPSDYRVPQTLHNMGILRYSDQLVQDLNANKLLPENDLRVAQIRTQTILAVERLLALRPDLQMHHVDGDLWFAGRLFDAAPGTLDEKKAAIRSALELHGHKSGFNVHGFRHSSPNAMKVATLRF